MKCLNNNNNKTIRMTSEISKVSVNGLPKISTYKQSQFRKRKMR